MSKWSNQNTRPKNNISATSILGHLGKYGKFDIYAKHGFHKKYRRNGRNCFRNAVVFAIHGMHRVNFSFIKDKEPMRMGKKEIRRDAETMMKG